MSTTHDGSVDRALVEVTARLERRFAGQLEASVVEETVRRCAVDLREARIVSFVPILVERRSRELLTTLQHSAPAPAPAPDRSEP